MAETIVAEKCCLGHFHDNIFIDCALFIFCFLSKFLPGAREKGSVQLFSLSAIAGFKHRHPGQAGLPHAFNPHTWESEAG